jgi:acyl carrier protein
MVSDQVNHHGAPNTIEEFESDLLQFLRAHWEERNRPGSYPVIARDTDLFGAGIVDSFGVIELIDYLEDTYRVSIDITTIEPDTFFTINGMKKYVSDNR